MRAAMIRTPRLQDHRTNSCILLGLLFLWLLTGCGPNGFSANTTPVNLFPTALPQGSPLPVYGGIPTVSTGAIPTNAQPAPTSVARAPTSVPPAGVPTLDANWSHIATGIDYRQLTFISTAGQTVSMIVARVDPSRASFRVSYTPGTTRTISDWRTALAGAAIIANANYFDTLNNPMGLVSADGALYGRSLPRTDAGLFQVVNGVPKVRSLFLEPYNNAERFDQVIQGYPMLMVMGQPAPAFDRTLNNTPAPRTVVAQDTHGRILIMVTQSGQASFTDMAQWLAVSGLEVDAALNLDGGKSTAMILPSGPAYTLTPGFSPVPVVLAVYPR